jgi:hypothetical protein
VDVLPLYARLSLAEQNRVFQQGKGATGTRLVLSTNVAESKKPKMVLRKKRKKIKKIEK